MFRRPQAPSGHSLPRRHTPGSLIFAAERMLCLAQATMLVTPGSTSPVSFCLISRASEATCGRCRIPRCVPAMKRVSQVPRILPAQAFAGSGLLPGSSLSNKQGCIPRIGSQFVFPHGECEISFCPQGVGKRAGACPPARAIVRPPGCHQCQPGFHLNALVHHPAMQQLLDSKFMHHEFCTGAAKQMP